MSNYVNVVANIDYYYENSHTYAIAFKTDYGTSNPINEINQKNIEEFLLSKINLETFEVNTEYLWCINELKNDTMLHQGNGEEELNGNLLKTFQNTSVNTTDPIESGNTYYVYTVSLAGDSNNATTKTTHFIKEITI